MWPSSVRREAAGSCLFSTVAFTRISTDSSRFRPRGTTRFAVHARQFLLRFPDLIGRLPPMVGDIRFKATDVFCKQKALGSCQSRPDSGQSWSENAGRSGRLTLGQLHRYFLAPVRNPTISARFSGGPDKLTSVQSETDTIGQGDTLQKNAKRPIERGYQRPENGDSIMPSAVLTCP